MGTKVRKRRSVADIIRLSAQTRLTAWAVFTELTRGGMDQATALRKALQDACPPKDDPYYRVFYPHKMREFELWRRRSLWPLSKPKDIEHDTGPHDTVEISTEVLNGVVRNGAGAALPTFLTSTDGLEGEDRIDTLEFDPVEVAKIIESYEQDPALFAADTDELTASGTPHDNTTASSECPYSDRPVPLRTGPGEESRIAHLPEAESERVIRDFFEGIQPRTCPLDTGSSVADRSIAQARQNRVKLDQTAIDELLAMLAWWKQHKERLAPSTAPVLLRPDFRSDQLVTKRISMNAKLWTAGEKAAKKQPEISGGTLSGLLEFLLWRHLGSTDKHLKR